MRIEKFLFLIYVFNLCFRLRWPWRKKFNFIYYNWNWSRKVAGGILRNKMGSMIMAFSYPTQFCTNYSEAQAALVGISWCSNQHFEALEVELDSMTVVQMINGIGKPPWRILGIIAEIKLLINHKNITVKHCYTEANEVADALAKYATQIQDPKIFLQEVDLLEVTKGLLRMNKFDFPTFEEETRRLIPDNLIHLEYFYLYALTIVV
ncbi:hypothetical protein MTR67_027295 [Solanum verrucosum]|uniref:RNase H type-1 domain-containing protein n=1 Tax=Solanum verrucosum TaxID=315347 RepID=A0AAF0TZI8_SOLVR|nr:hypothetical protein MTR67_027295 [Solanum verrucosum]